MNHCIECNAPLSGATRLCSACAEAALETFEQDYEGLDDYPIADDDAYAAEAVREYREKRIREWYLREEKNAGTEPYQEGDTVEEFKAGFRDILAGRTVSLAELDAYVEGDTEPNATDWQDDCAYDLDTGFCRLAYPNGCPTCPHWQAIGDVAT